MIAWCLSSLGCSDRDLGGIVEVADHWGIQLIELRGMSGSLDAVKGISSAWETSRSLCERLSEGGKIRVVGTSFHLLDHTDWEMEDLVACAALADSLRCPWMRVFGRRGGPEPLPDGELRRLASVFAWWEREKCLRGIECELLVETHDVFSLAENAAALVRCRPSAAILFDVEHLWRWWDVEEAWRALRRHVVHVHVKDARMEAEKVVHVLPGHGEVPVVGLLSRLADDGYGGAVSLEWERHWNRQLPEIEAALAAMRQAGWR